MAVNRWVLMGVNSNQWHVVEETVTAVRLVNHLGEMVVDEHGRPVDFGTVEQAERIAADWDQHRMPSWKQIQEMHDDEVIRRALAPKG
jgi:hypothetical protein